MNNDKRNELPRIGKLVSQLDHPVQISYMGEGMTIAPRAVIKNVDRILLGALPKGIKFVA